MLTAIAAIVIFSILVMIHEAGHFVAAKSFGVKVHEFSIGMGPAIVKKQKGETVYCVRWLPIGGYVKLEGEDSASEDANALNKQVKWKRIVIMAAGSFMNLVLGLIISMILIAPIPELNAPIIGEMTDNSAVQAAGLQVGDRVVKINNTKINTLMDSIFELTRTKEKPVLVTVERNNERFTKQITPIEVASGQYALGFYGTAVKNTPLKTIEYGFYQSAFVAKSIWIALGDLASGKGLANLSGPVGIVGAIGGAVDQTVKVNVWAGIQELLWLFMLITINLGVFNLLPLPALDGGRIFFVFVEAIIRRPIPPEKEGMVHLIGFVFLIGLMLFASYNDIVRLIQG